MNGGSERDSVLLLIQKHRLGWAAGAAWDAQVCFTCRNTTHKLGTNPLLLQFIVAVTYCSPRDTECVLPSCHFHKFLLRSALMTSGSYSFLFPRGKGSAMGTVWLAATEGCPGEGWPGGKGELVPSSPAPLCRWLPSLTRDLPQPVVMPELNRVVKLSKDVLQRLWLLGSHWAKSPMDYRKIMFIKNKSLLEFKSDLIVFTLKDSGRSLALVLSSKLEAEQ